MAQGYVITPCGIFICMWTHVCTKVRGRKRKTKCYCCCCCGCFLVCFCMLFASMLEYLKIPQNIKHQLLNGVCCAFGVVVVVSSPQKRYKPGIALPSSKYFRTDSLKKFVWISNGIDSASTASKCCFTSFFILKSDDLGTFPRFERILSTCLDSKLRKYMYGILVTYLCMLYMEGSESKRKTDNSDWIFMHFLILFL